MKFAIMYNNGMFLEDNQFCNEDDSSILTEDLNEAFLFNSREEAEKRLKDEIEMGYKCKVVKIVLDIVE